MRNIKITIEYDGTNYCGWQTQTKTKNKKSIQETLEQALRKLFDHKVVVHGSGRTDSGVHAIGQTANFLTSKQIPVSRIPLAINAYLPGDIVVIDACQVPLSFHSRFSALSKTYRYSIFNRFVANPLVSRFSYFYPQELDVKRMHEAAQLLVGEHDFKTFCAAGSAVKDTVRIVKRVRVGYQQLYLASGDSLVTIEIEANGFLYNMVRSIAGTLREVGRGKITREEFARIIKSRDRRGAGPTLPAQGLCLVGVKYEGGKG